MNLRAIIIDDETRARQTLRKICERYIDGLEIAGEAANASEGIVAIQQHQPDLVFLDINMPGQNGLQFLEEHVFPDLDIIFTTAYAEYAVDALRLQAHDYLLKPIGVKDLEGAMERFHLRRQSRQRQNASSVDLNGPKTVLLPTESGMLLTKLHDIAQCEAVGYYTVFFMLDGSQVAVTKNLGRFEEQFKGHGFYRVHHKHLINLAHLSEVNSRDNFLRLKNGQQVNISSRKKPAFLKYLKDRYGE